MVGASKTTPNIVATSTLIFNCLKVQGIYYYSQCVYFMMVYFTHKFMFRLLGFKVKRTESAIFVGWPVTLSENLIFVVMHKWCQVLVRMCYNFTESKGPKFVASCVPCFFFTWRLTTSSTFFNKTTHPHAIWRFYHQGVRFKLNDIYYHLLSTYGIHPWAPICCGYHFIGSMQYIVWTEII